MAHRTHPIVLAHSGASVGAIQRLADAQRADVVTLSLDLGQGRDLEGVRDRALDAGAIRAHVLDVREEFARDYFMRALRADAAGSAGSPQPTALVRPLVARKLVEIAAIEQAYAVAYCGCGSGRFAQLELPLATLKPELRVVVAPAVNDREVRAALVRAPADCPGEAAWVELSFERGVPVAVNGVAMPILDLIESLGTIAAVHGVGCVKPLDLSDAPAAILLQSAHQQLREAALPSALQAAFSEKSREYAALVADGQWFSPARESLDTWIGQANEQMCGDVRLKLFRGAHAIERIVTRKPPLILHNSHS